MELQGINKADLVATRPMLPGDRNFILATWLRGLRYGNDWFEAIDSETYFKVYHQVIEDILSRPKTKVWVCCLKDDPEVILAYVVESPNVSGTTVHWAFCKKAWRSIGLVKSLITTPVSAVSHLTKTGQSILRNHAEIKFNPFLTNL